MTQGSSRPSSAHFRNQRCTLARPQLHNRLNLGLLKTDSMGIPNLAMHIAIFTAPRTMLKDMREALTRTQTRSSNKLITYIDADISGRNRLILTSSWLANQSNESV